MDDLYLPSDAGIWSFIGLLMLWALAATFSLALVYAVAWIIWVGLCDWVNDCRLIVRSVSKYLRIK